MKTKEVTIDNGDNNTRQFRVVIYRDEDDVYIAECPALEGCMTDGATFEEAYENIKDAVYCHVSSLKKLGLSVNLTPNQAGVNGRV